MLNLFTSLVEPTKTALFPCWVKRQHRRISCATNKHDWRTLAVASKATFCRHIEQAKLRNERAAGANWFGSLMCFPAPQSKLTMAHRLLPVRPRARTNTHSAPHTHANFIYKTSLCCFCRGDREGQRPHFRMMHEPTNPPRCAPGPGFCSFTSPVSGHCLCSKLNYSINGCVLQHQRRLSLFLARPGRCNNPRWFQLGTFKLIFFKH